MFWFGWLFRIVDLCFVCDGMQLLTRLWSLTTDVLVIVERGTEPGFQLMLEVSAY